MATCPSTCKGSVVEPNCSSQKFGLQLHGLVGDHTASTHVLWLCCTVPVCSCQQLSMPPNILVRRAFTYLLVRHASYVEGRPKNLKGPLSRTEALFCSRRNGSADNLCWLRDKECTGSFKDWWPAWQDHSELGSGRQLGRLRTGLEQCYDRRACRQCRDSTVSAWHDWLAALTSCPWCCLLVLSGVGALQEATFNTPQEAVETGSAVVYNVLGPRPWQLTRSFPRRQHTTQVGPALSRVLVWHECMRTCVPQLPRCC
jgi:hypothetical protein